MCACACEQHFKIPKHSTMETVTHVFTDKKLQFRILFWFITNLWRAWCFCSLFCWWKASFLCFTIKIIEIEKNWNEKRKKVQIILTIYRKKRYEFDRFWLKISRKMWSSIRYACTLWTVKYPYRKMYNLSNNKWKILTNEKKLFRSACGYVDVLLFPYTYLESY